MANSDRQESRPSGFSATSETEGGLHAPKDLGFLGTLGWWLHFVIVVQLARLRFVLILIAIGVVLTKWDWLVAHYERWTHTHVQADAATAQSDIEYFCPMHPTIVRDSPKEKCPICFMPLSKRKKGVAEPLPPGIVNRVQLSPYRVVLAGVETWKVDYVPLSKVITTVGYVEFNERGLKNVSARVKGRLDALYVNETGQRVNAGDELASLYSPELVVTMQNLIDAHSSNNTGLHRSAAERLKLWGVGDDQIEQIARQGKAETHLKIRSPITGHVIKKYVREGQYVDEGTPLYDVADLATVWVQAQVYEEDIAFLPVHAGEATAGTSERLEATATTRVFPSEKFGGVLTFVHPHVDPNTRTLTVRFELENSTHRLRPGMTATVALNIPAARLQSLFSPLAASRGKDNAPVIDAKGNVLAVPVSSVIDTGRQTIVYRQTEPGVFEGVDAQLGARMTRDDGVVFFPILAGLKPGERVVTSGSFLVDAETRLNPAAGSIYFGGSKGGSKSSDAPSSVRPSTPSGAPSEEESNLIKLKIVDRRLAREQRFCAVQRGNALGSMGTPVKVLVAGEPVFLCCEGCRAEALGNSKKTLETAHELRRRTPANATPSQPSSERQTKEPKS